MTKEERKLESKNITIGFDAAKLDALEFVLRKQRSSVQRRMEDVLQQLYESEVPEACGSMWTVSLLLRPDPGGLQKHP